MVTIAHTGVAGHHTDRPPGGYRGGGRSGRPGAITGAMLKPGCVVIDVGMNRIPDPAAKSGTRLVGDVDFASALEVAGAITPVPGGVGPMTIAMLMKNTL